MSVYKCLTTPALKKQKQKRYKHARSKELNRRGENFTPKTIRLETKD